MSCANGLIANLYGPVEGRRHDAAILADSNLLEILQDFSFAPDGTQMCIYGDPAYPLRNHLQTGFKGAALSRQQQMFNSRMASVRVSVEWCFGDVVTNFAFLDFKKNLKVNLSPVGKIYIVGALMQNAHTCIYGNIASKFYGVEPPTVEEYFLM